MAVMELRCPNRHLVGRIIKYSVGSPLLLDMPKRLREDWKQVSERPMLTTHCRVCKRAVSKATDTVKERVDRLSDDEWEHRSVDRRMNQKKPTSCCANGKRNKHPAQSTVLFTG